MHGNVWEWCEDWFFEDYKKAPIDGSTNEYGNQEFKVLRGVRGSMLLGAPARPIATGTTRLAVTTTTVFASSFRELYLSFLGLFTFGFFAFFFLKSPAGKRQNFADKKRQEDE